MMRKSFAWRILVVILALWALAPSAFVPQVLANPAAIPIPDLAYRDLPAEARATLALIDRGGPFPFERDGVTFGNRERLLPMQPRGYYREYTVKTPGARNRGARRIVVGRAGERYYTEDHYRSFKRIRE